MAGVYTAIAGGLGLGGAYLGAEAAGDAATQSADAARYGADLEQRRYEQTRQDMMPWQEAGVNALAEYSGYGRSRVDPGQYIPQSNIPQYDPNFDVTQDPSYQFRLAEQNRGIDRASAGMGQMMSGNRLDEIMKRSGQMASQEYAAADARNVRDYNISRANEATMHGRGVDEYGRAYGAEGDWLNRLAGISNVGQTSTTNMGQFGATSAANQASAARAAGSAEAAGILGKSGAYTNMLSDFGSLAGRYDPNITTVTTDYGIPMTSTDLPTW